MDLFATGGATGFYNEIKKYGLPYHEDWHGNVLLYMEVIMGYKRQDVENTKQYAKKFVRYKEGAEKYSLGLTKFQALAKEAKAVYKVDGIALVNCEIFEKFLETFREY